MITILLCYIPFSEVYLFLKGAKITNGSYVDAYDIGENDSTLLCHTNLHYCCNIYDGLRAGEWYFPNGSTVRIEGWNRNYNHDQPNYFYRNRDSQVVRLNRRGNPLESGLFYCIVPDANHINRILYTNICKLILYKCVYT